MIFFHSHPLLFILFYSFENDLSLRLDHHVTSSNSKEHSKEHLKKDSEEQRGLKDGKRRDARRRMKLLFKSDIAANNDVILVLTLSLLDAVSSSSLSSSEHTGKGAESVPGSLSGRLADVFLSLDADKDGFLTASDFAAQGATRRTLS